MCFFIAPANDPARGWKILKLPTTNSTMYLKSLFKSLLTYTYIKNIFFLFLVVIKEAINSLSFGKAWKRSISNGTLHSSVVSLCRVDDTQKYYSYRMFMLQCLSLFPVFGIFYNAY